MPLLTFMNDPRDRMSIDPSRADMFKPTSWKLSDIYENDKYRSKANLKYMYDFGDGWEHDIIFLGVEDPGLRKAFMPDAEYDHPLCFGGEV